MKKSILITGGSGFLGHALARRLLKEWGRVCIYSRDEHKQAKMFEEMEGHPNLRMFIGDVRDRQRLTWAMRGVDVVIHAAALKRIETGHYNPSEMTKTNVLGTMNVIEAAIAADVQRVVGVSTDKAYQPVSAYGLSKAMGEDLLLASNNTVGLAGPRFTVCRFGNVSCSTGSVIPKWRDLISRGQSIYITDPGATRFWMTVDQAVDLVLKAITSEEATMIPELPAYRLADLAMALGVAPEKVNVVRLQPWEKKHETLRPGLSSDTAPRMTIAELRKALAHV